MTPFHKDGNGSVDSAHLVLLGHNEVVMLRRLSVDDENEFCNRFEMKCHLKPNHVQQTHRWPTVRDIEWLEEKG